MLDVETPTGDRFAIPETLAEDAPYFAADPDGFSGAAEYYAEHGYVVVRQLVPAERCVALRQAYVNGAKHSRTPMLRQKNMRYERNVLDSDGFLVNPIFNVQDLGSGALDAFRRAALDILTGENVQRATRLLLDTDDVKLIQSMFFEAPAGTWAHQDSYYQDSASATGLCVAGWFALEDIDAGAGRFYVCPGSHKSFPLVRNAGKLNFATGHLAYQQAVLDRMRAQHVGFAMPYLAAGDVLFWNSLTVHGSLPASRAGVSRLSLTAHYLRAQDQMLQFHSRIRTQKLARYNGTTISLLHDQNEWKNRLIREAAFRFPRTHMAARRAALNAVLRLNQGRKEFFFFKKKNQKTFDSQSESLLRFSDSD